MRRYRRRRVVILFIVAVVTLALTLTWSMGDCEALLENYISTLDFFHIPQPLFNRARCSTPCNDFRYPYLITNSDACSNSISNETDVFLLITVAAHHANVDHRRVIRQTWGGVRWHRGQRVVTLFFFGTQFDDRVVSERLANESQLYGDIVLANFNDTYSTLTNKTALTLHWVTEHCPRAKFVLKTDEDTLNVPQRYVDYLLSVDTAESFVSGLCFTASVIRKNNSKWFLSRDVYSHTFYPTYCSGMSYVLSQRAVRDIVDVMSSVPYLVFEDTFITGLCREAAGVKVKVMERGRVLMHHNALTNCSASTSVFSVHRADPALTLTYWNWTTLNPEVVCPSSYFYSTSMTYRIFYTVLLLIAFILLLVVVKVCWRRYRTCCARQPG